MQLELITEHTWEMMLLCVWTTPLGLPVVPLVYKISAGSSPMRMDMKNKELTVNKLLAKNSTHSVYKNWNWFSYLIFQTYPTKFYLYEFPHSVNVYLCFSQKTCWEQVEDEKTEKSFYWLRFALFQYDPQYSVLQIHPTAKLCQISIKI